jgi:hypothetical protein
MGNVPEGHTIDRKTGKVFRITSPKERSNEFIKLEESLEAAIKALKEFSDANSIDRSGMGAEKLPADKRVQYNALVKAFNDAKSAVKAYKGSHRDEFAAPSKGKGKQPERR